MATIGTANSAQIKNTPRRIYLAMENFANDFFTYTVTTNNQTRVTTGTLTPVTTDTSKTPQGRTLRETGKKLYPGANPGITTYMVGVYDDQTGLNGVINPNSPVFTVLNSDKPTYLPDGTDVGSDGRVNRGNSIYTRGNAYVGGDISGDGNVIISGYFASLNQVVTPNRSGNNFNLYVDARLANNFSVTLPSTGVSGNGTTKLYFGTGNTAPTEVVPYNGQVVTVDISNNSGYTQSLVINDTYTSISGYGNVTLCAIPTGKVKTLSFFSDGSTMYMITPGMTVDATGSVALVAGNTTNDGSFTRCVVSDPAVTASSKVFIYTTVQGANIGVISAENITNGAFTIVVGSGASKNTSTYAWFVVN